MNRQSRKTISTAFGIVLFAASVIGLPATSNLAYSVTGMGQTQDADSKQRQTETVFNDNTTQTFFEQLVPSLMKQHHIPGAVIAVVKDGRPLFVRGYGYFNLEKQSEVDPETTLFRIASITKLFTWTAVMQLVERGNGDPPSGNHSTDASPIVYSSSTIIRLGSWLSGESDKRISTTGTRRSNREFHEFAGPDSFAASWPTLTALSFVWFLGFWNLLGWWF